MEVVDCSRTKKIMSELDEQVRQVEDKLKQLWVARDRAGNLIRAVHGTYSQ